MMEKSRVEKRAYIRGYNRSISRISDRVYRALRIAKGYRTRLTDMDTSRQCGTCDRWTRGGDRYLWGKCRADFAFQCEGRMWAEVYIGEREVRAIITTEDFGCQNWLPARDEA